MTIKPGGAAGPPRCEAYTLLLSIATWRMIIGTSQGSLAIIGNALGILHDAIKLKAKDPALNLIVGELALLIAPFGLDIRAAHVWSERNKVCDTLSRLPTEATTPDLPELKAATRTKVKRAPGVLLGERGVWTEWQPCEALPSTSTKRLLDTATGAAAPNPNSLLKLNYI